MAGVHRALFCSPKSYPVRVTKRSVASHQLSGNRPALIVV